VKQVTEKIESESEAIARRVSYFGPLATAGITSLAYQHELRQHFAHLQDFVSRIEEIEKQPGNEKVRQALAGLKDDLASWLERAEMTNAIFAYFNDADNLKTRKRFRAKTVVDEIKEQVKVLARGIPINTDEIEEDLLLPKASLLEWSSIFQNVFINAFNAMLDSEVRLIQVSSRRKAREREILVQDTGIGVDLREAGKLFEPFERRATISPERRAIGYGGTGLGLTIVRLVARNIGCDVSFAHPDKGFRTAFSLKWRESE
jgi:signal transduction histidine kinase